MQETLVQFLSQEDPLKEENGNSLQYFCLKIPMDREAWQVTVQKGHKELYMTEQLCTHTQQNLNLPRLENW